MIQVALEDPEFEPLPFVEFRFERRPRAKYFWVGNLALRKNNGIVGCWIKERRLGEIVKNWTGQWLYDPIALALHHK